MSAVYHLPSSIGGIKRLAKSLKRQRGIPHMQALDTAAQQAGYQNLRHAKNTLAADSRSQQHHVVYVTSYWRDPQSTAEGRETMTWLFTRPVSILVPHGRLGFQLDALDHLEERRDRESADDARASVLRVIRHLQFADAAGVRPWTGSYFEDFDWARGLPRQDHVSNWEDLATGALLVADEPYGGLKARLQERQSWARDNGDQVVVGAPTWPGMYSPGWSVLLLATRKADELALGQMIEGLNRAPAPAVDWKGESAPYQPTFVSPARLASGIRKRSRPQRLPSGTVRNGARLVGSLPDRRWWRPNAAMPLANHRVAAVAIDTATAWIGHARSASYRKHIRAIRDDLDLWMSEEHRGLGDEVELYFSRDGRIVLEQPPDLNILRTLIAEQYPECAPRARLLKHVEAAAEYVARQRREGGA